MTLKRVAIIASAVLAVMIAIAVTVPFLIPKEVYRSQIERAATQALQRNVTLTGDVSLSVFPRIAAGVAGVTVANPEGFDGAYMVEAGELRGSVKWGPLLTGRVEIQELAFVDARVSLQRLADGQTNWVFAPAPAAGPARPAAEQPAQPAEQRGFNGGVEQARLTNASLEYRDAETGAYYELRDLNLQASMVSADAPFRIRARGIFQAQPFELSANVETLDTLLKERPADIRAELETAFAKVRYNGAVTLGEIPVIAGTFNASSEALPTLAALTGMEVPYDLSKLGRINLEGSLEGPVDALNIDVRRLSQTSDLMKSAFSGALTLGETPGIDGQLTLEAPSLAALARFAGAEMPVNLTPLGRGDVSARINGSLLEPELTFEKLNVRSNLVEAGYTGGIVLGEVPQLAGRINFRSPRTGELVQQMGIDLPAAAAMERVDLTAAVRGPADALSLTEVVFRHEGALLTASYLGSLSLAGDGGLNGQLSAESARLRDLLAAAEVELEPGTTLRRFSAAGNASGTFSEIAVSDLNLQLDDITARGNAGINLTGERPRLTGRLDMGALDLSPFLAPADQRPKEPQPLEAWSKDRLDLAGLTAADADLQITTSRLTIGSVVLTDAALTARLDEGRLNAELSRFKAFGGDWSGRMAVDAAAPVPAFSFAMDGNSVAISNLLGTLAGFDRLNGIGGFSVDASARGHSIDEIMRGLNGKLSTRLDDGALRGLNVTQLVRSTQSLQQAFATGNFNSLDFRGVLSPASETEFTDFNTVLTVQNGVANIDIMKLLSPVLGIDGTGRIDIGGQALDVRLAAAIDRTGQGQGSTIQLNGIPVPVHLSGSWSSPRVSPDFSGVQAALQAQLGSRLQQELTSRSGDAAGAIIGGLIGGGTQGSSQQGSGAEADSGSAQEGESAPPPPARTPAQQLEDAAEQAARDALGGLFGRRQSPPPAPKTEDEDQD